MFNFNQLKWMGEVLTNLLPWRERNDSMRYLSFLPMSHVVEGILAAYAPYCMLCRAEIYYLNDFQMLTKALPMVRPTVFFSVPRFYEKLWEQIEQNPLGRRYLSMTDGWKRQLTGRLLRRGVLRKAGLDKCSQLLVGSAPISEELLMKWRKPADGMVSLMIKLADTEQGDVHNGHMRKQLTDLDCERLQHGVHDNLYVADATVLPQALGLSPMLTIMALAKRISKIICSK